jgi:hypothetical protein
MNNDLNTVLKAFKKIIKELPKDSLQSRYYSLICEYLLLEAKHQDIVNACGKPILYYFRYHLPNTSKEYFEFLYHVYSPVRFAIETFDSIDEIKNELNKTCI